MKNLLNTSETNEWKWTTIKSVYNKIHKEKHSGCSYCGWNKGCNKRAKTKWYGGYTTHKSDYKNFEKMTYPSWKLATKNKQQWMAKPKKYTIKQETSKHTGMEYIEIKF